MIYEYGIEPELVATWHEEHLSNYFIGKFGNESGRIASFFPRNWEKMVWNAFDGLVGDNTPIGKLRLVELMRQIKTLKVEHRKYNWNEKLDWLENAELEHKRLPFHVVLSRNNPRNCEFIVLGNNLPQTQSEKFETPYCVTVEKTAEKIVETVRPMLRVAQKIILKDQHFQPDVDRYLNLFKVLIKDIQEYDTNPELELHLCKSKDVYRKRSMKEIENHFKKHLKSWIPESLKFHIFLWNIKSGGDSFHNRYILTDIGGVELPYGLDESGKRKDDEIKSGINDEVIRLGFKTYQFRLNQLTDSKQFAYTPVGNFRLN